MIEKTVENLNTHMSAHGEDLPAEYNHVIPHRIRNVLLAAGFEHGYNSYHPRPSFTRISTVQKDISGITFAFKYYNSGDKSIPPYQFYIFWTHGASDSYSGYVTTRALFKQMCDAEPYVESFLHLLKLVEDGIINCTFDITEHFAITKLSHNEKSSIIKVDADEYGWKYFTHILDSNFIVHGDNYKISKNNDGFISIELSGSRSQREAFANKIISVAEDE